jgi:predicted ArsR family transcriptional regulator
VSRIEAIAALHDPLRKQLYDFVATQGREVSRNEAAAAAGVQRTLAAFHLDKLVDAGLLEVTYRRLSGRDGPGAGRPAKLYRRASGEHSWSVPPRSYALAANLLAEAVDRAGADPLLQETARAAGREIGRAAAGEPLPEVMRAQGYEPYELGGELRLRNCPFHRLAERFPPLVCGMNLALCQGVLEGLGEGELAAELAPAPPRGECCVVFLSKNKNR